MDIFSYHNQHDASLYAPIRKSFDSYPLTAQDVDDSMSELPQNNDILLNSMQDDNNMPSGRNRTAGNPMPQNNMPSGNTMPQNQNRNIPVTPLPNPGEGGPIPTFPTDETGGGENVPVVPLPNPGEGGPIPTFPPTGNESGNENIPVTPLPNPGEGGPIPTFPQGSTPTVPPSNSVLGTIITMFPRPIIPCFFCNTTQFGTVRFLNAAAGYNPFLIYINDQLVVRSLDNAEVSQYGRVSAGTQTITVAGQNGYVFIQKQISVRSGSAMTVAIINTPGGLDLMTIFDTACFAGANAGCFRTCNLSYTNPNIHVSLNNTFLNFRDVRYREVTNFAFVPSGNYRLQVRNSGSNNALVTSNISIRANASYTAYVFNWNLSRDAIRTLVVEDRR